MLIFQIVHWSGETGQGAGSHSLRCHLSMTHRVTIPILNMGLDYFIGWPIYFLPAYLHPLWKGSFHGIKPLLDHFVRILLPYVSEERHSAVLNPTAAGPSASSDCFAAQHLLQIPSDIFSYVLVFSVKLLCWPKQFECTHLGSSRPLLLGCCCLQCSCPTVLWEQKYHCSTDTAQVLPEGVQPICSISRLTALGADQTQPLILPLTASLHPASPALFPLSCPATEASKVVLFPSPLYY